MMNAFLSFTGYDGNPILIAASKIMAIRESPRSTPERPLTTVIMATVEGSEEWLINETLAHTKTVIETLA